MMKKAIKKMYYNIMLKLAIWLITKQVWITIICSITFHIILNKNIVYASHSDLAEIYEAWLEGVVGESLDHVDISFNDNPSMTSYEHMHGRTDPNDTSENDSKSENESGSDSEKEILDKNVRVAEIFDKYKTVLKESTTPEEVIKNTMDFMHTKFPHELLAKTEEELGNSQAPINVFQDKLMETINFDDKYEYLSYIYLRAGISTYNSVLLLNAWDDKVIPLIFFNTVNMLSSD